MHMARSNTDTCLPRAWMDRAVACGCVCLKGREAYAAWCALRTRARQDAANKLMPPEHPQDNICDEKIPSAAAPPRARGVHTNPVPSPEAEESLFSQLHHYPPDHQTSLPPSSEQPCIILRSFAPRAEQRQRNARVLAAVHDRRARRAAARCARAPPQEHGGEQHDDRGPSNDAPGRAVGPQRAHDARVAVGAREHGHHGHERDVQEQAARVYDVVDERERVRLDRDRRRLDNDARSAAPACHARQARPEAPIRLRQRTQTLTTPARAGRYSRRPRRTHRGPR